MALWDRSIGTAVMAAHFAVMAYFLVWMLGTPFIDRTHFTQALFPPREYGLLIPTAMVVIFFSVTCAVAAWHITFSSEPAQSIVKQAISQREALPLAHGGGSAGETRLG